MEFNSNILSREERLSIFLEKNNDFDQKILEYSTEESHLDKRLKAEGVSDFRDFIDQLIFVWNRISTYSQQVPIVRERPKDKQLEETATISFALLKREPTPEYQEFKPKFRQQIKDPHRAGEFVSIYGQHFDYYIRFTINAQIAEEADDLAEYFEEFLMRYVGFFKNNGVSEILFVEQQADLVTLNSKIEVNERPLVFKIRLERLLIRRLNEIEEIELQAKIYNK